MKAANVEDIYPLSPMQHGILFEELSAPGSTSYNVQVMFVLSGEFDADALGRTWELTVERHPLLRTSFHWKEAGKALQVVRRRVPLPLARMDWSGLSEAEQEARLREFIEEDRQRAFDLASAPLMRLALIELGGDRHRLVWTHHHLLLDGWSLSALLAEVFSSYEALAGGRRPAPPPPPRPFRDYVAWLQRQDMARAESFWREYLRGFTAPTPLPLARQPAASRGPAPARGHAEHKAVLTGEATEALWRLARTHRITLNTVVQGAWAVLLSRYAGSGEVVFGATVSGRPAELEGVERMLGLFINTLPVRADAGAEATVGEWLRGLQELGAEARQYEYAPLSEVRRWGEVGGGLPLFDSVLSFMNYPVGKALGEHARLRVEKVESFQRTNFGLSVVVAPGRQLGLHIGYDTNSFEAAAVARVAGQLKGLLESIAADPEQRLSDLSLLTDDERRQLIFGWNDTARPFPREACLHELFERQAALTPAAEAVVSGGERLTYAELDSRANRLANHLRAAGVGPETRVAILLERSSRLLVSILGVLKAGGCYVPLDPQYPRERIAYTLEDSAAALILTQARLAGRLPEAAARVLKVDAEWERIARASGAKPAGGACSQNLAYVIYTSGSTGAPKGVMVAHRELVNYLVWCREVFEVGEGHGSPIHAPVAFDGTKTSLFFPLTVGQSLVMLADESGVEGLVESFRSGDRYSLVKITPAHLDLLSHELSGAGLEGRAKTLIVGGEALRGEHLRHWIRHAPGTRLIQEYGPTETTVSSCWYEIPRDEALSGAVPIGRPISNTQVFILDAAGNPAPVGATGEVYIGGDGLARGYLNRPALTAERFVPDPFGTAPGARLYKTGDLAKFLPDGNVEFVGRADSQVKLRGFRVELGEIEAVLCQHPSVAEAAVVVRPDEGGRESLVAYVAGGQQAPPAAALREHLKAKLPDHMIPSAFMALDRLPLTPNGKVDRKALPAPAGAGRGAGRDYAAPRTPEEEIIAAVWQQVLGVGRVGATDNFLELGGHSLLATQVMSRVRRALGVALPLRALFEAPTVAELAERVEALRRADAPALPAIVPVERTDALPLSFAQERLWF
ncbi:MAG TPA: amino acid adenylation domain-containing protein, partial [Pyrinomonadaceae bacterium]|nr:amino acid adenylation domain-containing protein [Pyrinomonadaceae bacterium]